MKTPEADSDAYFASRALESRVGAWASQQSQPVESLSNSRNQAVKHHENQRPTHEGDESYGPRTR